MKHRMLYIVLGAAAIAAAVGIFIWRSWQAETAQPTRSAVVGRGTIRITVSASGAIAPRQRANLSFEQTGLVAEVLVEMGETVKAGDVLARLDTSQLALQVRQARAGLVAAESQLAQLRAGPRPEEIAAAAANVEAAEAQVSSATAALDQLKAGPNAAQIAAAEADLAAATIQQQKAEDLHNLTMKCFTVEMGGQKREICPALGQPEEQARYNLEVANEALTAAQARYDELLAGANANQIRAAQANVSAAIAQRDAAQAQLNLLLAGPGEAQLAAAEAQVTQARAALERVELALEQATLRAPFDGVIATVNVKAHEMAPTGLPAITMIDTTEFHVTISVDEMDVARLAEGQAAQVTVEALPDTVIPGTIESIAPAATLSAGVVYYEVTIRLEPTSAPIRADMTSSAAIMIEELNDVLTIPSWVVRVDEATGQTYVDRQVGNQTERVDVALGARYEGTVQVLDGLSEGDVVVWVPTGRFGPQ